MSTTTPHSGSDRRTAHVERETARDPGARSSRSSMLPGTRALVLAVATGAAAAGLALGARSALGAAPASAPIDLLVAAAVLAVGAMAAATLALGSLLLLALHTARATGRTVRAVEALAHRCTPAVLRRVVAAGVGVGLGLLGPAGTAAAEEPDLGWTVTTVAPDPSSLLAPSAAPTPSSTPTPSDPWAPLPPSAAAVARPAGTPAPSTLPSPAAVLSVAGSGPEVPDPRETVTVRPGDSLWTVAARHLGSRSAAQVSTEWPRWYAANRAVIGADPDLIRPGQVLVAPARAGADA